MDEGQLFRKLRKDRGLNLENVSDEMNSVSFISKFEKGHSNISWHRLERLLENINVSMEEFLYLRAIERNPNLNQEIGQLNDYLTSDFYVSVTQLIRLFRDPKALNKPETTKELEKFKQNLNPKTSWQGFLIIYCDLMIFINQKNIKSTKSDSNIDFISEINHFSKPVISYLYQVEDWGVFEIMLFNLFLFTFKVEEINQLLPLAISRTEKESKLSIMSDLKMDIIFSSFSYFVNFRHQKWARETLDIARRLLKDEKNLLNSTFLLFYEGWYQLIFEDEGLGTQTCHQAISIFRILDQPSLEKLFNYTFDMILMNQKHPDSHFIFM